MEKITEKTQKTPFSLEIYRSQHQPKERVFSMSTILPNFNENRRVLQFFMQAKLGTFLHQANIRKEKGFSPRIIVQFIFALALHGMSFFRARESDRVPKDFEKDTVYTLLKNPADILVQLCLNSAKILKGLKKFSDLLETIRTRLLTAEDLLQLGKPMQIKIT
jgi:hypothetical protein